MFIIIVMMVQSSIIKKTRLMHYYAHPHSCASQLASNRRFILQSFLQQRNAVRQRKRISCTEEQKAAPSCDTECGTAALNECPEKQAVTCQTSDGAHPVSHMEAWPAKDGADQGPTENGCGSSHLRVAVIDVVQDVWDILLLCGINCQSLCEAQLQLSYSKEKLSSQKGRKGKGQSKSRADLTIINTSGKSVGGLRTQRHHVPSAMHTAGNNSRLWAISKLQDCISKNKIRETPTSPHLAKRNSKAKFAPMPKEREEKRIISQVHCPHHLLPERRSQNGPAVASAALLPCVCVCERLAWFKWPKAILIIHTVFLVWIQRIANQLLCPRNSIVLLYVSTKCHVDRLLPFLCLMESYNTVQVLQTNSKNLL